MLTRRQVVLAVGAGALATISYFAQPAGPARIGWWLLHLGIRAFTDADY
jgi:hypothetical protein